MKKLICLMIVMICTGCAKKQDAEVTNPCRDGLIYQNGQCFCGSESMAPEDSVNWDCIENTHYLCLFSAGCTKAEVRYPTWSHFAESMIFADKTIPAIPNHPKGYQLTVDRDDKLVWSCLDRDCICGKGTIHGYNHDICQNESFKAQIMADCGDEKCGIENGVCRDGKCWCEDTWQGPEPSKYACSAHIIYGNELLEGVCVGHPELCVYIQSQKTYNYEYFCKSEEGCQCGNNTCRMGTICRQDKCYCGTIDSSQYEELQNYDCTFFASDHAMVCKSEKGCKCGDHRIVKGAECIDGKQICNRVPVDWVDENVVSQYACDDLHPMIVCDNQKGCKCGKNTCLKGASCMDGECVCGNQYRLNDDVAIHKDQYVCYNGQYICNLDNGCDCDEEKCVKGSTCDNAQCGCGEITNTTIARFEHFECEHGDGGDQPVLHCHDDKGCKCFHKGDPYYRDNDQDDEDNTEKEQHCDKDDYYSELFGCHYDSPSPYLSVDLDNAGFRFGEKRYSFYEEERPYELRVSSCRDCDQFSLYEYHDDGSCLDVSQSYICKVNGGCLHDNQYYPFNTEITSWGYGETQPPAIYAGFPDKKNETDRMGEGVAVCNHIYPLGVLRTYLKSGTITEIRDTWVCDDDTCTCGSQTCHLGDLCQAGKCSPYKGCSTKTAPDKVVFYCHGANQKPIPQPDDSTVYLCRGVNQDRYGLTLPNKTDDGIRHWFCDKEKCGCGDHFCPILSYCEEGECFCGGEPLKEGFICYDDKPVCNSTGCSCGGEPLREGYQCSDDRQVCNTKEGCICGNQMIRKSEICDRGVGVCSSVDKNAGCRCGEKPLPKGYICKDNQFVCDEDLCICGTKKCGRSDICDNGVCKCGAAPHQGCLCGADVVERSGQYKCIDNQMVCNSDDIRDTDSYPEGVPDCDCGAAKIPQGAVCKGGKLCEDCEHPIAMRDKDGYFHKTCEYEGQKLTITYHYVAECHHNSEVESENIWDSYICEDGTSYYSLYKIDPCECLAAYDNKGNPVRQEELSKYYCSITQYYKQECSERVPEEVVEGWEPLHPEEYVNLCEEAEKRNATILPDWDAHTCLCGKAVIPMAEAKNYLCDLGLNWRCNRDEGCACGNATCQKSQICIRPGECSR